MTEETTTQETTTTSAELTTEQLQKELAAVKANRDELLEEKKRQQRIAQEADESSKKAKEQTLQQKGEFEQLFKSANQERETLREQIKRIEEEKNQAAVRIEASKIANKLAEGHNAEILTDYLERRIKYTNDGYKVTDAGGALTVSTLSDLEAEFAKSEKYKSLRRGTKATGGGAAGTNGGAVSNAGKIDRDSFNAMKSFEQGDFIKRGGLVTD